MLALPAHGFVVLSAPKCASTALEEALGDRAEMVMRHHPRLKHVNVRAFHRYVAPLLGIAGYERDDYEVVSLLRDPVDWLHSWWRYRQSPHVRQAEGDGSRWTGSMEFAEFAAAYVAGRGAEIGVLGRPARFVLKQDGSVGVDRLFAYERTDVWQGWLRERLGEDLEFPVSNRSPVRTEIELDDDLRARLAAYFAPEEELRARVTATGEWAGARGSRLTHPVD